MIKNHTKKMIYSFNIIIVQVLASDNDHLSIQVL